VQFSLLQERKYYSVSCGLLIPDLCAMGGPSRSTSTDAVAPMIIGTCKPFHHKATIRGKETVLIIILWTFKQ